MYVHPANCPGDCCNYDTLTDDFATDLSLWGLQSRARLDQLRKTSRPETPGAANPASHVGNHRPGSISEAPPALLPSGAGRRAEPL